TVGLAWVDVEGYEPQVLDGLAKLMARAVPITFEFTPSRYAAESKQRLVARLAEHYTTVHSLGRLDPAAPIAMLAAREHTDDVLRYWPRPGAGTDKTKNWIEPSGPIIILVEPQLGANIGATARVMANFGLARLRLVKPRDGWPNIHARRAASGAD